MHPELTNEYNRYRESIQQRLSDFKNINEKDYIKEFKFCLLTPQSNAQRCWQAILELEKNQPKTKEEIASILKTRTRFHNNKAGYIMQAQITYDKIKSKLSNQDKISLRNFIAENVKGYGLKEAGHFLRNIGKSDNQIAILDRHILRNLKSLGVIDKEKIKNKKDYLEIENKFLQFSNQIKIPIDELDLLFWSKENGEIFK